MSFECYLSVNRMLQKYNWNFIGMILAYYWNLIGIFIAYYWNIIIIIVVCLVFHPTIAGGSLSGLATPTIISFLEYYWYINRVLLEYYWIVIGMLLEYCWNVI